MLLKSFGYFLDTIHITITRPRGIISFVGENGEPTDKLFYGVLDILAGRNYEVKGGSKKFVNNGSEYIQSNPDNIIIQLRSAHLMKFKEAKIEAILAFLNKNGVPPKAKRKRGKNLIKEAPQTIFYQITRLDFCVDIETRMDLVRILNRGIGYDCFIEGIQKDYFYRTIHDNKRKGKGLREHKIKELKFGNAGFEVAIYNKKLEIIEVATPEKLSLYPPVYKEIIIDPKRQLFRLELRYFRSRSIAFNNLSSKQLFELAQIEISKFGKSISLIRLKNQNKIKSSLFTKIFSPSVSI